MDNPIVLGSKVKDSLSSFSGTAIARAEYLFDVPSVLVQSAALNASGKAPQEWFPEARLEAA